jgi:hypothetical protein
MRSRFLVFAVSKEVRPLSRPVGALTGAACGALAVLLSACSFTPPPQPRNTERPSAPTASAKELHSAWEKGYAQGLAAGRRMQAREARSLEAVQAKEVTAPPVAVHPVTVQPVTTPAVTPRAAKPPPASDYVLLGPAVAVSEFPF